MKQESPGFIHGECQETPYDIIDVNGDNTVTAYYNNQEVTVPYKKINNESFSFILPFDNQLYSVVIDDISPKDTKQNEKPEMRLQSGQNVIQPARGDGLFGNNPKIAIIKNNSGFLQVLIDNTDQFEFSQESYGRIIADQGSVKSN